MRKLGHSMRDARSRIRSTEMNRNIIVDGREAGELTAQEMERVAAGLYITSYMKSLWYKVRADSSYSAPSLSGTDDGRE
jgi:hypothetical protein